MPRRELAIDVTEHRDLEKIAKDVPPFQFYTWNSGIIPYKENPVSPV